MIVAKALPLSLLIISLDIASVSASNLVSRAVQSVHSSAVRHTRSFASDLRIAFGAVLQTQTGSDNIVPKTRVVYCKSGTSSLSGGNSSSTTGDGPGGDSDSGSTSDGSGSSSSGSATGSVSTPWKLQQSYAGDNFFDGWDFWTDSDPTHGIVDYVDEQTGRNNGLVEVNSDGHAIMRVETTPTVSGNRKSIRITTHTSFNNGALFIMDAVHMPQGCGTWPAFWTNGPNWPQGGEIDIVEGVGDYTNNQATIHTNPGCSLTSSDASQLGISGSVVGGTNCAAAETNNQGCGVRSTDDTSYGSGFNGVGGGVYAMQWDEDGVAVFFFARNNIPSDISAGTPLPSNWGKPMAKWAAAGCDPFKFFYQQVAIFDTTLCGDWAGGVWGSSGIPGQEQSCAQRTGFSTCEAFVQANGASFDDAYWEVKSVKVYQKS